MPESAPGSGQPCCDDGPPGHTQQEHHDASPCYDQACRFDHPKGGPFPHPCDEGRVSSCSRCDRPQCRGCHIGGPDHEWSGRVLPPEGWVAMGTHAGPDYCAYTGPLEFSAPHPEDGLPRWERHDGCAAVTAPARGQADA